MPDCLDSKRLMRRQATQAPWNVTAGDDQGQSESKERAENHRQHADFRNSTEHHASKNETSWNMNQGDKNGTEQSQSTDNAKYNATAVGNSKEEKSRESYTSKQATKQPPSTASSVDNNLSPPLSLNTSLTPEVLASMSNKSLNGSQSSTNDTLESSHSPNTNSTYNATSPVPSVSSELKSPTNITSPLHLQSPTTEEQPPNTHHSKGKACGIAFGCLAGIMMIAAAIFFIRKRLKGPTNFVRRHLRSRSNDSNRAVRDRSSLEPQLGGSDPFACPSSFSKKPLILRPESCSQIRNSNPRRPSVLHLRSQSIKSQISPPIIEPPSPGPYHALYGGSHRKTMSDFPRSQQGTSHIRSSSPSWYQNGGYPPAVSRYNPGVSQTLDPYNHPGTPLSVKNPDIVSDCHDDKFDTSLNVISTPVPPRPPRPEWPILPFDSTGIHCYTKPVAERVRTLPAILPLNVSRRPGHRSTYTSPRRQSIDRMILESPESCQDSPTLPQYRPEADNSTGSIDREPGLIRASHLSRSTCYSQSSEGEVYPIAGSENVNSGPQTPTSLKFVSFGPSSNSTQLERQLDYFTSHMNRSDKTFSSRRNS
ncbi:hypothetical protein PCANC_10315 [Puccinia coronata f. sp. avenae]|uniref:Uncharacterized protein n=1 Tax=Puccinia coronata f. sp. avenae TaxID=200324 RepID=A0A2N5SXJ6_9BASI|nr:hypothetical protein PCANC_10315 [Puccinia coronata f. sp. avenae]